MEGAFQVSHKEYDGTLTVVAGPDFDQFWTNLMAAFGEETANAIVERMRLALLGQPTSHRPEGEDQPRAQSSTQSRSAGNSRSGSSGQRSNNRNQGSRRASNGPPPGSEDPECDHGLMEWKEGVSRAGNDYAGWFCVDSQCPPVWPGKG